MSELDRVYSRTFENQEQFPTDEDYRLCGTIEAREISAPCTICGRDAAHALFIGVPAGCQPLEYPICQHCQAQPASMATVELSAAHALERLDRRLNEAAWVAIRRGRALQARGKARLCGLYEKPPACQGLLFDGGAG